MCRAGSKFKSLGAGTPAANAKIEAGDVIVGVGNPQTTAIKTVGRSRQRFSRRPSPIKNSFCKFATATTVPQPITVRLMRRPFAVVRPEIENYRMREVEAAERFCRSAVVFVDAGGAKRQAAE